MHTSILRTLGVLAVLLVLPTTLSTSAQASPIVPALLGTDISYPQCPSSVPTAVSFAVVGVTNGKPFTANPCVSQELSWAATLSVTPSFYTVVANPGPLFSKFWPSAGTTLPESCDASNQVSCSYDYGWNSALASFASAQSALLNETPPSTTSTTTTTTPPVPTSTSPTLASTATWWLDVETASKWQSLESAYGPTPGSYANDQATLSGMISGFRSVGITNIGIYATSLQWGEIMGPGASAFSTLPVWLAGFSSQSSAATACANPSSSGGPVAMTQFSNRVFDFDVTCAQVNGATGLRASVSGASAVLSWQAPASGATSYSVSLSPGGAQCVTTSTTCLVSGLSVGASYSYVVNATQNGVSVPSTPSQSFSVALPVVPFSVVSSAKGTLSVTVTPLLISGQTINYQYSLNNGPWKILLDRGFVRGSIRALSSGKSVSIRIRAVNATTLGTASSAVRCLVR